MVSIQCCILHVRSLVADDEQQGASLMAEFHSATTDDDLTSSGCHTHSINSCSAGARDTLAADSSDVLAVPT